MKMVQSYFDFIPMIMVQLRFILETRWTLKYSKRTMDQDNFLLDNLISSGIHFFLMSVMLQFSRTGILRFLDNNGIVCQIINRSKINN